MNKMNGKIPNKSLLTLISLVQILKGILLTLFYLCCSNPLYLLFMEGECWGKCCLLQPQPRQIARSQMLPVSWNLSCWYCCDELLCLKMLESFQDEHPLTRSDELLCLKMLESIQDEHPLTRSENITSSAVIFVSAKFPRFREKY